MKRSKSTILVTGAAGFIGSHLVDSLIASGARVIGVDNLSRGRLENIASIGNPDFSFIRLDLSNENSVLSVLAEQLDTHNVDAVWHMAANSDIPAGVADPQVDLKDTFKTTFNVLALMRRLRITRLTFASTSAIYGLVNGTIKEETGPLLPISNYGAFKLASEAIISAAAEERLSRVAIFRFPNVIGPRATHGVIFDLMNKLKHRTDELEVLGDGTQQKPYLHVQELLDAMFFINNRAPEKVALYNIAAEDDGVPVSVIAQEVLAATGVSAKIRYTGGDRGWVGDVPKFKYSTQKLRHLGWQPSSNSLDAVKRATREIARELGF